MNTKEKKIPKVLQFATIFCFIGLIYLSKVKEDIGNVLYWSLFAAIAIISVYLVVKIKPSKKRLLIAGGFILLTLILSIFFFYSK